MRSVDKNKLQEKFKMADTSNATTCLETTPLMAIQSV